MMLPVLISASVSVCLGALSAAREAVFLALVFLGLPALGVFMHFFGGFNISVRTPSGSNHGERIADLYGQIPGDIKIALVVIMPAFIAGRMIAAFFKAQKEKELTPEKVRDRKKKILKSYNMS